MACANDGHVDLLDLDAHALSEQLKRWGLATAHAKLLRRYLYRDGERDFAAMHDLPPRVRERLAESATLTSFTIDRESQAVTRAATQRVAGERPDCPVASAI